MPLSFGRLDAAPPEASVPGPETPFRIAILGNFGGRKLPRADTQLEAVKLLRVDRDNIDQVMAKVAPEVEVILPGVRRPVRLKFQALDDLHPDGLYQNVDPIQDADSREERRDLMNALLHDETMLGLESAWRGLDWLLRRVLKKDIKVEAVLIDLDFDELHDNLNAADDLSQTFLYRLLIEQGMLGPKGQPWSLIVGDYLFDLTTEHMEMLGKIARIARHASAPFLAGAHPHVLQPGFTLDEETEAAWQELRQFPESSLLGLATPRFLLRPPYGERTLACERFDYEEFTGPTDWHGYLWGNSGWAAAALLGLAFHKQGWAFKSGAILDLDGMALHVYEVDGDEQVTAAEVWLKKPDAERLANLGLMPLLCVRNKDAVQLLRFQSLAQPSKGQQSSPFLGRWAQKGAVQLPRSQAPGLGVKMTFQTDAQPAAVASVAPSGGGEEPAAPAAEGTDPELEALLKQMEGGGDAAPAEAPAEAPPAEEDPELAALLAQLEGGGETPPAEPAPAPEEPPGEDPELAALLAQLEGGGDAAPPAEAAPEPPPEAAPPAGEDPELAALLAQLEGGGEPEPTPEPAPEPAPAEPEPAPAAPEGDDELAALLAQLEGGGAPEEPAAEVAPEPEPVPEPEPASAAPEGDDDLAALLAQLEGGTPEEPKPAPEPASAPEPEPPPAAEGGEDELAALLAQLEGGGETAAAEPEDPAAQVETLGGRHALEDLGWPMFVPAFAADTARQLRLLQGKIVNKAAQEQVQKLVQKCGGKPVLDRNRIPLDQGLLTLLAALRNLRGQQLLTDDDAAALAKEHGANLKLLKASEEKSAVLLRVEEFQVWASDPRHADTVAALEGTRFNEKWQVYQEQQYEELGGDKAWRQLAAGPNPGKVALAEKLEQLRAIKSARE